MKNALYQVVATPTLLELIEIVNMQMTFGWRCAGGIAIDTHGPHHYFQAMYREQEAL